MAREYRESEVKLLLEAHLDQLKKINEGIQSVLVVQKEMKKELESMRPIKEEWPIVKLAITNTNIRVQKIEKKVGNIEQKVGTVEQRVGSMDQRLIRVEKKVDNMDKKVTVILPDHEKRITRLEVKPA